MSNLPFDGITYEDRNGVTADDFHKYCKEHPELRFWQALYAWAGVKYIFTSEWSVPINPKDEDARDEFLTDLKDMFYVEGKDGKVAK